MLREDELSACVKGLSLCWYPVHRETPEHDVLRLQRLEQQAAAIIPTHCVITPGGRLCLFALVKGTLFVIVLIYGKMADFTVLVRLERPAPPPIEKA